MNTCQRADVLATCGDGTAIAFLVDVCVCVTQFLITGAPHLRISHMSLAHYRMCDSLRTLFMRNIVTLRYRPLLRSSFG